MKLIKIKNKEISQLLIDKICKFKMKYWKYNLNSQLNFFYENHNNDDLHFILMNKNKILAYNVLKKRIFTKLDKSKKNVKKYFFLFDSFLVDKNLRNQNLGSKHLKENKIYLKRIGKPSFLLCKKKLIDFYTKNDWKLIKNKNFIVKNYRKKKYLMSFNFSLNKQNKSKKFILNLK